MAEDFDVEQFVYIKIEEPLQPADRFPIEDAIDKALEPDALGGVTGGGSLLGKALPDGTRPIEFCGIDVDAKSRELVLPRLRALLPRFTQSVELHYTSDGVRLQDRLVGGDWVIAEPRSFLHPGFDI